jgi:hypothetical protein
MVKKAVQAASARGASSSSIIHIQISDIDADFGDSDPLTLLERFKVSHCRFSSAFWFRKNDNFLSRFLSFRRTEMFFTTMSKNSPIESQRASKRCAAITVASFNAVSSAQFHHFMLNNC